MRRTRMRLAQFALLGALAGGVLTGTSVLASAFAQEQPAPPHQNWSFDGIFGTYDRAAAQRGFLVYQQVCSACHSMKLMHYRDLAGIGLSEAEIKAVAASVQVPTIDDSGQPAERPGLPSDAFKSPFPNDKAAAAANNGAIPPDQSVLANALEGGADEIYGILTGYTDPPAGVKVPDGLYYNKYFPGHFIHMPKPLSEGQVTYADGTNASVEQMARDVTTFLEYAANPEMEQRKRMGVRVVLFLVLLTGLTYAVKRKLWANVH